MAPEGERPSAWALVRESLAGTTQDLTAIPIRRSVVLLAVPTVLEMAMESLLTVVDIFYASRLGSAAVATVGLTESMLSLVYALAMGLSAAVGAIVSRRTGEQAPEGAAVAATQAIGVAVVGAAVLGALGAHFAPRWLGLIGAEPALVAYGGRYARIVFAGNLSIFLLFIVNAVFRSAGASAVAMRSLWLANGLNILLAPCLMFGLRLGIEGAALATIASRGVGVAYQLVVLAGGRARISVARRHIRFDGPVLRELLGLAWTGALQVLVETASWLGLVRILSAFGGAVLAGYTIAMRVAIFAMLPSWGLASAAATLVGQNLGARRPDRARSSVYAVARYNVLFLGTVGVLLALAAAWVVRLFTLDAAVSEQATSCLRIVALGFLFFAYGMVIMQAFNGAGDTRTPTFINLGCFWLFKIPLAFALSRWLGPRGVFFAIAAAYSAQAVIGGLIFRRGRWQTAAVALLVFAGLTHARGAQAAECAGPPAPGAFPLTEGKDLPLNAHVFVQVFGPGEPTVELSGGVPAVRVTLEQRSFATKAGRVLELVPQAPLAPKTEYRIEAELAGHVQISGFSTGEALDLVPPVSLVGSATALALCDRGATSLRLDAGAPLDARYAWVWLPDGADRLDRSGPPDRFVPVSDTLVLDAPLDAPTRVALQLVDGAGNRGARSDAVIVGTMTVRKRLRVLGNRLSRGIEEQRGGFVLTVLVVAGAGFWSLRRRPPAPRR